MKRSQAVPSCVGEYELLPATLLHRTDEPLIRGVTRSGRDIVCPSCERVLLANIGDGEVFDIVVWCRCGTRVTLPALPPGRGLGGIVRELRPGVVTEWAPYVNECEAVVCGAAGRVRRERETSAAVDIPERLTLDTHGLGLVVDAARMTFDEVLMRVEAPLLRGRSMAGSKASELHRLVQLLWGVEQNRQDVLAGGSEVDVLSAIELQNMFAVFARWRHDPLYPRLLAECVDPQTFLHNYGLFCTASAFVDTAPPLGAELVPPTHHASADLRVRVSATRSFAVEVKTPQALQRRHGIDIGRAVTPDVLRKAIRRSRTQISSEECGILALVGNSWAGDIEEFERAAILELSQRPRPYLAGVVLVSTSVGWSRQRGRGPFEGDFSEVDWDASSHRRWVANRFCFSNLRLDFDSDFSRFDLSWKPAV